MFTPSLLVLLASAGLINARSVREARHVHGLVHQRAANDDSTATTLAANAIQSGSFNNGILETGSEASQAASLISQNNFINNCAGKTLTNGLQITTGSCNGITMGDIPAKSLMISSIITYPLPGSATIESDTTFNISVQTINLVAGSFTNADATYYAAPQALSGGKVVGHTHVTVQDMGKNLNPTTPLDATQFAFFKGINDPGNGQGLLQATVTGGLPAGNYRVCTLTSSSNHQPVIMPVAQRGSQDDCTKFTVIGSGTTINIAANNGTKGIAAAAAAAAAVSLGPDVDVSSTVAASSAASSSSESTTTTKAGKGSKGDITTTSDRSATTTKAGKSTDADTTTTSSKSTNTNLGKGGKTVSSVVKGNSADTTTSAVQTISTTVVQKVTVIETLFEFALSLGGLPPSVSKKGNQFFVLEEIFDDITLACGAACEQQFTTCTSLTGPGFSLEECSSQKESCASVASSATSSANPMTITATVTVPPTATVTGTILSEGTISTTFTTTSSAAAVPTTAATTSAAAVADVVATSGADTASSCSFTTSTIFVDAPATTAPSSPEVAAAQVTEASSTTSSPAATGTGTAALAVNTATLTSALGGIAAPAITDSGDSTRPFEVNGNTFVNKSAAVQRSCDIQFNACANAFNSGSATGFNISDCQTQEDDCITAGSS